MTEERKGMNIDGNGYEMWWDEENGIVRFRVFGIITTEQAKGIHRDEEMEIESHGTGIDRLIDATDMKKVTLGARKEMEKLAHESGIGKFAFFGASTFIRTLFNMIAVVSRRKNVRFFKAESAALRWLKGGRQ